MHAMLLEIDIKRLKRSTANKIIFFKGSFSINNVYNINTSSIFLLHSMKFLFKTGYTIAVNLFKRFDQENTIFKFYLINILKKYWN